MALKKNDFIEIEFTGKIKDGEVFDSNIKETLKKINPKAADDQAKPFSFALGQGMFLKGIDDFLIGKDIGSYSIELSPEKGFGKRLPKMMKIIPAAIFAQQKISPSPGMVFNFDGKMGKVLSVSGGRIRIDFNHPLAGKTVIYDVKVLKKIGDQNEKIKSFISFLFKKDIPFEVKDKNIVLQVEESMVKFVEMFEEKFKEIFGLGLKAEAIVETSTKQAVKETEEAIGNKNENKTSKN